jgi:hypothetical protein
VDRPLHQESRTGDTGLPGGGENPGDHTLHRVVQVGVVEDDVGRLAAEFQRHALQARRGGGLLERVFDPDAQAFGLGGGGFDAFEEKDDSFVGYRLNYSHSAIITQSKAFESGEEINTYRFYNL